MHTQLTTGKTIALTIWTFIDKVMSLLFNMLSRLVITFLPRSKWLLISWLQSPSAVIFEPPKIKNQLFRSVNYLGPNYGGCNEDNGDLLQKVPCMHCYTQHPRPCSRPPPMDTSAGDSWALRGKSGSASCGVTALFSCILVHTKFCLCLPSVCFPLCVSSGSSMVGLMMTSSKGAYAIPSSAAPRAHAPVAVHCWPVPAEETV